MSTATKAGAPTQVIQAEAIHLGVSVGDAQIKSKERVRDLAEVYTNDREVQAMLDLVPDMFVGGAAGADIKFLEPACGSGNFLEAILRRKLAHIRRSKFRTTAAYEHRLLRAVASIYGVDICGENVAESRERMLVEVRSHYCRDANTTDPSAGFEAACRAILGTNIIRADFLADAATTEVVDYQAVRGESFRRVWSMLDGSESDGSGAIGAQLELFDDRPVPKVDAAPVHYLDLAANPNPVRASRKTKRRAA